MTPANVRALTAFLVSISGCYLDLGEIQADPRFSRPAADGGASNGTSSGQPGSGTGASTGDAAIDGAMGATGGANGGGDAGESGGSGGMGEPDAGVGGACDNQPSNPSCGYQVRRKLSLAGPLSTEELQQFPVLITLNESRIDYAKTLPDGRDLRFLDADGATLLAHEIELWSPGGTSYVWVKVPRLVPGSSHHLFMVYGNPNAPPPTRTAEVFSTSYESVYHLGDELGSRQVRDACERHHGEAAPTMNGKDSVPGRVGRAIEFDGIDHLIVLGDLSASGWESITVEAWVRPRPEADGRVLCQSPGPPNGPDVVCLGITGDKVSVNLDTDGAYSTLSYSPVTASDGNDFTHLAFVWAATPGLLVVSRDGFVIASLQQRGTSVKASNLPMVLGNINSMGEHYLEGVIDEVRISREARSEAWLQATVAATRPDTFTYGPEETL